MIESTIEKIDGMHFLGIGMTPDSAFDLLQGKAVRVRCKGLCVTVWRAKSSAQLQKDLQVYENGERLPIFWIDAPVMEESRESRVESTRAVTDVLNPLEFILRVLDRLTIRCPTWKRPLQFNRHVNPTRIELHSNASMIDQGHIELSELEAVVGEVLSR